MNNLPFNPQKIGKCLKISGEHTIFLYGKNQIIKFPSGPVYLFNKKDALRKIENDFKLLNQYFQKYLAPSSLTFFLDKNKQKKYCIIQKLIQGRTLKIKDLKNQEVKKQFLEILKLNQLLLKKEKYAFEFFGIFAHIFQFLLRKMENILITPDNRLFIIDIGLISYEKNISSFFLFDLIIKWAFLRQEKLLKKYIQITH